MSLEGFVARLNAQAFWKEFTFARNTFSPQPGRELELADNIVWLGDFAFALQLKERVSATRDPAAERIWFEKKVIRNGTRQIRDTMRFLGEHMEIHITNERGHRFAIRQAELTDVMRVLVFAAAPTLPEDCSRTRYHRSSSAGFIHVVAAHDYLDILETLRVPKDIRGYFVYREKVVTKLTDPSIDEPDIMGAFLNDDAVPASGSREALRHFVQDVAEFDLSPVLRNLHDHIAVADRPYDYYRIMLEFARVPRSVWRETKTRVMLCLEATRKRQFVQPFRLTFPETDCTFMVAALDPEMPATGAQGEALRVNGLKNLTRGAKYHAKSSKGIGMLFSADGEYIQIDWCLVDHPWEHEPELDEWVEKHSPFRPTRDRMLNSFNFKTS